MGYLPPGYLRLLISFKSNNSRNYFRDKSVIAMPVQRILIVKGWHNFSDQEYPEKKFRASACRFDVLIPDVTSHFFEESKTFVRRTA